MEHARALERANPSLGSGSMMDGAKIFETNIRLEYDPIDWNEIKELFRRLIAFRSSEGIRSPSARSSRVCFIGCATQMALAMAWTLC